MKNLATFLLLMVLAPSCFAQSPGYDQWGPTNCGAQVSLSLDEKVTNPASFIEVTALITIRNNRNSEIQIQAPDTQSFCSFTAVLPNGKTNSIPKPKASELVGRELNYFVNLKRGEHYSYKVDLRKYFGLYDQGPYTITLTQTVAVAVGDKWQQCELVSNELKLDMTRPK